MALYMQNTTGTPGFWGPVTATLDWCEENYQFSHYICEVANSFSNLFTVGIALHGANMVRQHALPSRYLVGWLGFAAIGIGSFAFHATLLYEAQLADELPMIYVVSYNLFLLCSTQPGFQSSLTNREWVYSSLGLVFATLFTWSYIGPFRNPVYHQVVFATVMISTVVRSTYLLRWSAAAQRISPQTKSNILRMFTSGAAVFVSGFAIWNLDNIFCNTLTDWKVAIGWPLAWLLEGHSWWHVLTAMGTYLMTMGIAYLTLCVKEDPRDYTLGGHPVLLPHVERAGLRAKKRA